MTRLALLCLASLLPALSAVGQQPPDRPRTFTISGRVINSHGQPPTDLTLMVGHNEGDGFSGSSEEFRPDGTFTTRGLTPGRGPVLLDGRDITNEPTEFERYPRAELEVVFTQVVDDHQRPRR
jgi:hypothetical protein